MSKKLKKFLSSSFALLTALSMTAGMPLFTSSADESFYFMDHFEDGNHSWTGRGAAKLQLDSSDPYDGVNSLLVSGRTAAWNGAMKELDMTLLIPLYAITFDNCSE